MRTSSVRPRLLAAALASVACLLLMPSVISPLFAAKRDPAFPRLSENLAGSERLEVRKVLHGGVDGLFALPGRGQVIAAAGGYLWKFDADGGLLDTLRAPGHLHVSGVAFAPDHYVDWVFTGDRARKPYATAVDGNALSQQELHAELDRADVVAFGRDDASAWAWLWRDGRAWKLDIGRHRERVDRYCRQRSHSAETLRWESTCLQGYERAHRLLREIEPESFAGGYGEVPARLEVVGFDRRRYHLEDGVGGQLLGATVGVVLKTVWDAPGALPGRYWFGDAHVRLRVGDEAVQFKAFVPKVGDGYEFLHGMDWWEPGTVLPGASPWFSVRMRSYMQSPGERELLPHYAPDIGLYVVRPRSTGATPEVPAWRPLFEGPPTRSSAVTGTVELASGARTHRWLRPAPLRPHFDGDTPQIAVDQGWPDLHALPSALQVEWGNPWAEDAYTVLRLDLSREATRAAFARLRGQPAPLHLVVKATDLHGPGDAVQVVLRGQGQEVPVAVTSVAYLRKPAFRPVAIGGEGPSRHEQMRTNVEAAKAGDRAALQDFLRQAETLAADPERAKAFAASITVAYAELLNAFNRAADAGSASALARHYLERVHAHTSVHTEDASVPYNAGVIASQTLAFALHRPQDSDLVAAVLETLIGADFDPEAQTNGTLMYNLACHYALAGDIPRMLQSVAAARRLGKPAGQFLGDADFGAYHREPVFLRALEVQ